MIIRICVNEIICTNIENVNIVNFVQYSFKHLLFSTQILFKHKIFNVNIVKTGICAKSCVVDWFIVTCMSYMLCKSRNNQNET